jgi:hypothetical protein
MLPKQLFDTWLLSDRRSTSFSRQKWKTKQKNEKLKIGGFPIHLANATERPADERMTYALASKLTQELRHTALAPK